MNSKTIAVDFDGTLCEDKWPGIGAPNWEVIDYLRDEKIHGGAKLILWTCRTDGKLKDAIEWCKEHGLKFDAINENLPEKIDMFGTDPRKIGADEYIDDKACTKFKLPFVVQKKEITKLQVLDDMYNPIDFIMVFCTGGLWLVWILRKSKGKWTKKRNSRRFSHIRS